MWSTMWNTVVNFFTNNWINMLIFLLVLIVGAIICKVLISTIRKIIKKSKLEPTVANFIAIVIKFLIVFLFILILCSIIGIPVTSIIALFTAASLAIGLAVQNSVSNLANGLVLLSTKPYKVGDFVDIGGTTGTVLELKLIHTVLLTPTNERVSIPHNTSASSVIKNFSAENVRRVDLKVSVDYSSNIDLVKEVLWHVVSKHEHILQDKDNRIRLLECSASSLDFTVRVWVDSVNYWSTYFDLQECFVNTLRENDISIPFTTIDVNIKNDTIK